MTESEWLTSTDPRAMLNALTPTRSGDASPIQAEGGRGGVSDRQLRLWVEACRHAGRRADREFGNYDLETANGLGAAVYAWCRCDQSVMPTDPLPRRAALLRDVVGNPWRPVPALRRSGGSVGGQGLEDLDWQSPWLTPTVLSLARAAYDNRTGDGALDPARLSILADALEEGGCPQEVACPECGGKGQYWYHGFRGPKTTLLKCHACGGADPFLGTGRVPHPLLAHLRGPGPHVRGCWVIDLILGNE